MTASTADQRPLCYVAAKRLLDIAAAGVGIVVLAPLYAVVAGLVKLDSAGPVFYRGVRVGAFGRQFRIWKFRTMTPGAESLGGSCTSDDDRRVTRAGRFLRKYKIDELPQLLNVFTGEMSLVGRRPDVESYTARLRGQERIIMDLQPGITDWASIWYSDEGSLLAGKSNPEAYYDERILPVKIGLQVHYARTCSFLVDLRILACTAWKLVRRGWIPKELVDLIRDGAREDGASHRRRRMASKRPWMDTQAVKK